MRDGVRLGTGVHLLPAPGRLPTVLIRTPYEDTLIPGLVDRFTEAGFAVVAQDVRGRLRSEGVGEPFRQELADGSDTCDWIVRQPWSDGSVCCWGNSYYGFAAWAAVASGHTAIRAAVTRYITTDIGGELVRRNGVLRLGPMVEWLRDTWRGRRLASLPGPGPYFGPAAVPMLHCAGWFDSFQAGQLADWRRSRGGALLIAATDHQDDHFEFDRASPDHFVDPVAREAMLDRSLSPVIDFLRGARPAPVRWELTGAGPRTADTWPPPAQPLVLSLGSVGWEHDPDDPVPCLERDWWRPLLELVDERVIEGRPDVVTFTSRAWADDLDLAGPVSLRVTLAAEGTLVVKLCEVGPDGRGRRLLEAPCHGVGVLTVPIGDLGYRLRAGHRLRVQLASSCFPLYPVDPLPYRQRIEDAELRLSVLAAT
ncbi:MAG TPA: CocE/NonD family hydrolase [Pseudonocardiaceae bacterium]|nr:CocE/NonD family hydrolase [Pseudonocardiaceae bacterium]